MRKPNVAIVIPIYKPTLTANELLSLRQCLQIFAKRDIYLVCPDSLDITFYTNEAQEYNYHNLRAKRFRENYFKGIEGYNKLMLSLEFYKNFKEYEFIQIYQLDAWVFRDELDYWCEKGYDYIGAPWFNLKHGGLFDLDKCGNGGFSLRKVSSALRVLKSHKQIESFIDIWKKEWNIPYNIYGRIHSIWRLFKALLKLSNNTYYYFNNYTENEDLFWSSIASTKFIWYKIPTTIEASHYSFETYPSYLYKILNFRLPSGCHAWEKNEPDFWRQYIKVKF